jgi:hypothetical protein
MRIKQKLTIHLRLPAWEICNDPITNELCWYCKQIGKKHVCAIHCDDLMSDGEYIYKCTSCLEAKGTPDEDTHMSSKEVLAKFFSLRKDLLDAGVNPDMAERLARKDIENES